MTWDAPRDRPIVHGVEKIDGGARFGVPGIATFDVTRDRIVVGPVHGVPTANVRLFLLGTAMGLLAHLRGLLPLHANAVEIDGEAVAFAGPSGCGKSTLAAWFHDRGHRLITDDVCVISTMNGAPPLALPGLPRVRLWRQALERSGRRAADYAASYAGDEGYDKFDVEIALEASAKKAVRLDRIFVLGPWTCLASRAASGRGGGERLVRQHLSWRISFRSCGARKPLVGVSGGPCQGPDLPSQSPMGTWPHE